MVEEMRRKGDHDGADKWLRIMAIGEHGEPPTEARHSRPALYRRGDDFAPSLSFSAASRSISVSA